MKLKNLTLLIIVLLVADQALKIWVKTHMQLDEAIIVFPDWFQLRFIENKGAAYGMHIASSGAFDWGKLLLGIFRIALSCLVGWLIWRLSKRESTPWTVAHFGGHYAGLMMGKVVDMFYFPLFQWNSCPGFLRFLVDSNNYFFGAIFNLADVYISLAAVYLLVFQYKFISK